MAFALATQLVTQSVFADGAVARQAPVVAEARPLVAIAQVEVQADLARTETEPETAPLEGMAALQAWLVASYERAPALLFGLAALLAVPPLVMTGRVLSRRDVASREATQLRTQMLPKTKSKPERPMPLTEGAPRWPTEAWIETDGPENARHALGRTVVRIGREGDNDICLSDKTVHRYHAAVHRTEDADFVITDLSTAEGNGVKVNGAAVNAQRLEDGDVIELGLARLKFIAKPA
jgi:hypothetical protein